MRTKIEEDFLAKLEEYILELIKKEGLVLDENASIVSLVAYSKFLTSEFLDTVSKEGMANLVIDCMDLPIHNNYEECHTVLDLLKNYLISKHFMFTLNLIKNDEDDEAHD